MSQRAESRHFTLPKIKNQPDERGRRDVKRRKCLSSRKKKTQNATTSSAASKPLEAWLERINTSTTQKSEQNPQSNGEKEDERKEENYKKLEDDKRVEDGNRLEDEKKLDDEKKEEENKTSLRILNSIDKITRSPLNKDMGGLRNCHTLSEKFRNYIDCRNHRLTEYFPVRRSVRKTKKTVMEEKQKNLEECVLSHREDGLKIVNFEGKGRGVVTTRKFMKGEFVVEYSGELIDMIEAKVREEIYSADQNTGCYMYYFKYKSNQFCIDATAESGRLGRLVNHSRNGNLTTKIISIDSVPHLVLIAKEDINYGEEVCYDYGDRSKRSLKYHPWLAS